MDSAAENDTATDGESASELADGEKADSEIQTGQQQPNDVPVQELPDEEIINIVKNGYDDTAPGGYPYGELIDEFFDGNEVSWLVNEKNELYAVVIAYGKYPEMEEERFEISVSGTSGRGYSINFLEAYIGDESWRNYYGTDYDLMVFNFLSGKYSGFYWW